jgi:hypothetical protein
MNFSNSTWFISSIFYIHRDLLGFYMLKKSILEDKVFSNIKLGQFLERFLYFRFDIKHM